MKVPHHIQGWSKIGIFLIESLTEEEQDKMKNVGDTVSRQTEHKYLLFKNVGDVTASERPLAMMYHRRKSIHRIHRRRVIGNG